MVLYSCNDASTSGKSDADTLIHSDTFNGVYSGLTPCADCPGIKMQVNFSPDSIFYETLEYLERDTKISDTGRWKKADSLVTVEFPARPEKPHLQFKIMNDSAIRILDASGNIITGPLEKHFILKKADTLPIP